MGKDTTTEDPATQGASVNGIAVDDQGMALPVKEETTEEEAQPEEQEEVEAVAPTTEPEQEPETAKGTDEPSDDEQLAKFAETKGLKLDSENATKAARMAMNAEKLMHEKTQRASELEKDLSSRSDEIAEEVATNTGQDPELLKRLQRVEVKEAIRDFWDLNPEARAYEAEMIKIVAERPHLAGDLDALYAVARSGNSADKSQTKREVLTSLAQKQQAAVPTGNAVDGSTLESSSITPENVDALVGKNSVEWFQKNQKAINKAMAG